MKVNWKEVSKSKGYQALKQAVIGDCAEGQNCFNTMGCNKESDSKCCHRYCNTFKWAIDKAKHFAYKYKEYGITMGEILDLWATDRREWYVNYFQDCYLNRIEKIIKEYLSGKSRGLKGQTRQTVSCALEGKK